MNFAGSVVRASGNLLQEDLCQHATPPRTAAARALSPEQATADPRLKPSQTEDEHTPFYSAISRKLN